MELCAERDLSSYSRFTKGSVSEFMTMFSKTVAERTKQGQRQDIQEQGKLASLGVVFSPPLRQPLTAGRLQISHFTSTREPKASPE